MSTYLQGSQDYLPSLQPFHPDFNFLANVLQTRQSRYDKNYEQLSSVYTSLFNSPMSRESDIKIKDDFFKNIDQNIKKVSGMDLSLQQNVDAAGKVFQPFLDNKILMNDMVKTKQAHAAADKMNSLKSCIDPDKCGGEYSDTIMKAIQYKLEEFSKTSDQDSMNFQMPEGTPKYNWQKDALTNPLFKDYNVSVDHLKGGYIVHDVNGSLVKGGLLGMYTQVYGNDPRVQSNYNTEAYVNRMDYAHQSGQYNENDERTYMTDITKNGASSLLRAQNEFQGISNTLHEKQTSIEKRAENEGPLPSDPKTLDEIIKKKAETAAVLKGLSITHNAVNNNSESNDINVLRFRSDAASAHLKQQMDLMGVATVMSHKGEEHTMTADPYGLQASQASLTFKNESRMALLNHEYTMEEAKYKDYLDRYNPGAISSPPTIVSNTPGNTYVNPDVNDKTVAFNNNSNFINSIKAEGDINNKNLIFGLISTINQAAHDKSSSAIDILNKTFGKNKIQTQEDLDKYLATSKIVPAALLDNLLKIGNEKMNDKTELSYISNYIDQHQTDFSNARLKNQEFGVRYKKEQDNRNGIWNSIQALGKNKGTEIFSDADLMKSGTGTISTLGEFTQKYLNRYAGYRVDAGDAEKVYNKTLNKFNDLYSSTIPQFNQAKGLKPGADMYAPGIKYDVTTPGTEGGNILSSLINSTISSPDNSGKTRTYIGPSDMNAGSKKDEPEVAQFLRELMIDHNNPKKTGFTPNLSIQQNPIAGGDPHTMTYTVTINNPEHLGKEFFGTDKNPTDLVQWKKDLMATGKITVAYSDTDINTITGQLKYKSDDGIQTILNSGQSIHLSNTKGDTRNYKIDPISNKVIVTGTEVSYDNVGNKKLNTMTPVTVDMSSINTDIKQKQGDLKLQTNKSIAAEQYIRDHYKNNPLPQTK